VLRPDCSSPEHTIPILNGVRAWIPTGLVTLVCLTAAPAALADTATSSNWAGYAAHRPGVSFKKVSASWRQPSVSCTDGVPSYSAYWVGIGGFSPSSNALEQIGTEADCTAYGRPALSAWYELVPAPSAPIGFSLGAGDVIDATVTVNGHRVTVSLYDATRRHGFTRTLTARSVDTSSAEWIVEAPSECAGGSLCDTLPLANFGSAIFTGAKARSSTGRVGSIASSAWGTTKIDLVPGARQFTAYPDRVAGVGAATTSSLQDGGSSFKVTYSLTAGATRFMTVRSAAAVAPGQLVHPVR
jgi:hypothetical protein